MAVYTQISLGAFTQFLTVLGLQLVGTPVDVADGMENSTYFFEARSLKTGASNHYVLTLFENCTVAQQQFSSQLSQHLAALGLPVPAPLPWPLPEASGVLSGKNALVFPKVLGRHLTVASEKNCAHIGAYLANSHVGSSAFGLSHANSRGLSWFSETLQRLTPILPTADKKLLTDQLASYQHLITTAPALPIAAIHGDLFKDNALFDDDHLTGVIDFTNASTDWQLLDIAITLNDWCWLDTPEAPQSLDLTLAKALLSAYQQHRPFTAIERQYWQAIVCLCAARFLLSRWLAVATLGAGAKIKSPDEYRHKLLQCLAGVPALPSTTPHSL